MLPMSKPSTVFDPRRQVVAWPEAPLLLYRGYIGIMEKTMEATI